MATEITQQDTTFYHVAGADYEAGTDLLCWEAQVDRGWQPVWKFDGDEAIDTDVVCLFRSLAEAADFRRWYGGTILTVTVPAGEQLVIVGEGYPAIRRRIPADWIAA